VLDAAYRNLDADVSAWLGNSTFLRVTRIPGFCAYQQTLVERRRDDAGPDGNDAAGAIPVIGMEIVPDDANSTDDVGREGMPPAAGDVVNRVRPDAQLVEIVAAVDARLEYRRVHATNLPHRTMRPLLLTRGSLVMCIGV
jgi:hypothetical protein